MTAPQVFALTASALWLKMFATAGVQAVVRLRSKRFARPEDAQAFGGAVDAPDHPTAVLGQAALRNDVENIPTFLCLLLGFVLLGPTPIQVGAHGALFVLARCVHTAAYLRPTQPLRNRAYVAGVAVTFSLVGHIVWLCVA